MYILDAGQMLTGRRAGTGSNKVLDFGLGQPYLLPRLANHISFEKAIAFVRLTSVYLCSSTGLGKPGQGKNSLGDQVIPSQTASYPFKGYAIHSWASGAFTMPTLNLCALRNGGVTLVGMNLVGMRQGYRKADGCLAHPLPRGLGKSQGKHIVSLLSHHRLLIQDPNYRESCREVGWAPQQRDPEAGAGGTYTNKGTLPTQNSGHG